MVGIDAVAWKTFDYPSMRVPAAGGGLVATARPALWVRTRPHDHTPWATGTVEVYAFGVIGSGAFVTAVPMWMLDKLGIAAGERTEVSAYSASGQLRAYKTMIGMEISHGGRWQDLGTVNAIAPDAEWSRNPKSNYPILLGLDGFFDRLGVCIDHSARTFQLGRAGGWT